jgi:putative N6-adenine-specific DNA methylase
MQRLRSRARERCARRVPIFASDLSFRMVDFARRNAERAGVAHAIQFNAAMPERPAPSLPPSCRDADAKSALRRADRGRRQGARGPARDSAEDRSTPSDFFARLATHWKKAYTGHPAGWTAWILSPDMRLPSAMRLKDRAGCRSGTADRVPAVPLRAGRRLGAHAHERAGSAG